MSPNTKCAPLSAGRRSALLFEKDLPVSAAGLGELLVRLQAHVPDPEQLLVLIEATGVLHLNWSAALTQSRLHGGGDQSLDRAPALHAGKLHPRQQERSHRCAPTLWHRPVARARSSWLCIALALKPEQFCLQRLHSVRKAVRKSLSNLKKSYRSLLDVSFPELGELLEIDGVGIRQLLSQAPTPCAIARMRRSTLEKNWMLRPKAAQLKKLAADSMADPELAQASKPALLAMLQSIEAMETRLAELDRQIETLHFAECGSTNQSTGRIDPRLRTA